MEESKLNLLRRVRDTIEDMGGLNKAMLLAAGVTLDEVLNPTPKTLTNLLIYKNDLKMKNRQIERLDFNL